jgi:hypothetical protein
MLKQKQNHKYMSSLSKPKYRESDDFDLDYLDNSTGTGSYFGEDDLMQRRRDEEDAIEENDPDDLANINIG